MKRRILIGTSALALAGSLLVSVPARADGPAPVRTIAGAATLMENFEPNSITVGPDGKTYVAMKNISARTSRLVEFAADASGNQAPTILENESTMPNMQGLTTLREYVGVNRVVVDHVLGVSSSEQGKVYRRQVSGTANLVVKTSNPTSTLATASAVAIGANDAWYVANSNANTVGNNRIVSFTNNGTTGSIAPTSVLTNNNAGLRSIADLVYAGSTAYIADRQGRAVHVFSSLAPNAAPSRTIQPDVGFSTPTGIAVDSNGYIYVSDSGANPSVVYVFEPNASGTVVPAATITTGVTSPVDVAIGPDNSVFVLNAPYAPATSRSITVYAPLTFPAPSTPVSPTPDSPVSPSTPTSPSAGTGSNSASGPSNEIAPVVVGASDVGATVTGAVGEWSESVKTKYQWFRCKKASVASAKKPKSCKSIKRAKKLKYTVTKKDKGKYLVLRVTATSKKGSTVSYAASTAKVA